MLLRKLFGLIITVTLIGGAVNAQDGHGTHTAGTIGAMGNNSVGLIGGGGRDLLVGGITVDASQVHPGGINVLLLDGSVRGFLKIRAVFPLATDPGRVRVRFGRIAAPNQEACLSSSDFSAARPMDLQAFQASYDAATGTETFGFGVEREMNSDTGLFASTCHVVRFDGDGDVDGRDFLVWQRGGSPNPSFGDGSVRFVQYRTSGGF